MKKIYPSLLSVRLTMSLLLSLLILGAFQTIHAQVFFASNLSGSNESPPNASPGSGKAMVIINGTSMTVQATFSGLVAPTTAAHIHAPTALPGVGTAGVATTTPSFPGFPLGVTSGIMNMTFDMTLSSSFRAGYLTDNGGTPASAFAALKDALNSGKAYFNIHSQAFPGGEIRAFFQPCPTLSVSIPDAYALPSGTLPNTVYPAYAPASSITLEASASGGAAPYSYLWSGGSTTSDITVSPAVNTTYTVNVMDNNGCPGSASKTVAVVDVAGGKKGDKIVVCHKGGKSLEIDATSVADHLGHGDMLGSCSLLPAGASLRIGMSEETMEVLPAIAFPNPSLTHFDLSISGRTGSNVQVKVYDLLGRVVESMDAVQPNQIVRLGASYTPGLYIVNIVQGGQKQTLKLLKGN